MGNSYQNQRTPDGNYAPSVGNLHLLPEEDRTTGWDLSVNPSTSWAECDLSNRVPKGTRALMGWAYVGPTDAVGMILTRDANSSETNNVRTRMIANDDWDGNIILIKATDGKFDYKEHSNAQEVAVFNFELHGYYI